MAVPTQGTTFEVAEIYPVGEEGNTDAAIDLRQGVVFFQYFEDLMSPVITAKMGVTASGSGVYHTLPIRGGEEVKLHFTSPWELHNEESPGLLELTMYVNKISNYESEKQKESFVLELVSKEGIVNLNKRVIKKYKATKISDIIKDFLKLVECEYEDKNIETTQNTYNFIGNMRKPFTLAPTLSSRAIPEGANSASAGFFLWQTKTGMKFKSIETIIKNKKENTVHTYKYSRINKGGEDPEDTFNNILQYTIAMNNNVMGAQSEGSYSTYRIYWNPYTFKFTEPSVSVFKPEGQESLGSDESPITEEAKPENIPSPEMAHRIVTGVYSVGCLEEKVDEAVVGAAATTVNMDNIEDVSQSISRYASLFTQVITLTVAMNVKLEAGDIIKLVFPKVSEEDDVDHAQSGLYIIKELSHFVSGNKSYSALKVIRDTSGD